MTADWHGVLASIGAPSTAGWALAAGSQWVLDEPAPLLYGGVVVGSLHSMIQAGDQLRGRGTVDSNPVAVRMLAGELFPEIDILPYGDSDLIEDADGGFAISFRGGRVVSVTADASSAFAGASFVVDPAGVDLVEGNEDEPDPGRPRTCTEIPCPGWEEVRLGGPDDWKAGKA